MRAFLLKNKGQFLWKELVLGFFVGLAFISATEAKVCFVPLISDCGDGDDIRPLPACSVGYTASEAQPSCGLGKKVKQNGNTSNGNGCYKCVDETSSDCNKGRLAIDLGSCSEPEVEVGYTSSGMKCYICGEEDVCQAPLTFSTDPDCNNTSYPDDSSGLKTPSGKTCYRCSPCNGGSQYYGENGPSGDTCHYYTQNQTTPLCYVEHTYNDKPGCNTCTDGEELVNGSCVCRLDEEPVGSDEMPHIYVTVNIGERKYGEGSVATRCNDNMYAGAGPFKYTFYVPYFTIKATAEQPVSEDVTVYAWLVDTVYNSVQEDKSELHYSFSERKPGTLGYKNTVSCKILKGQDTCSARHESFDVSARIFDGKRTYYACPVTEKGLTNSDAHGYAPVILPRLYTGMVYAGNEYNKSNISFNFETGAGSFISPFGSYKTYRELWLGKMNVSDGYGNTMATVPCYIYKVPSGNPDAGSIKSSPETCDLHVTGTQEYGHEDELARSFVADPVVINLAKEEMSIYIRDHFDDVFKTAVSGDTDVQNNVLTYLKSLFDDDGTADEDTIAEKIKDTTFERLLKEEYKLFLWETDCVNNPNLACDLDYETYIENNWADNDDSNSAFIREIGSHYYDLRDDYREFSNNLFISAIMRDYLNGNSLGLPCYLKQSLNNFIKTQRDNVLNPGENIQNLFPNWPVGVGDITENKSSSTGWGSFEWKLRPPFN